MKKTAIFIAMMTITMMAMGQTMSVNMEDDDPGKWERQFLHLDYVTHYGTHDAEYVDLDSIVDYAVERNYMKEARGISSVILTSDTLDVSWKESRLALRYWGIEFNVDSVETGLPSPIRGFEKALFHLDKQEGWNESATATLLYNERYFRLYIKDNEVAYYFKGFN